jgi:hypothetical protein
MRNLENIILFKIASKTRGSRGYNSYIKSKPVAHGGPNYGAMGGLDRTLHDLGGTLDFLKSDKKIFEHGKRDGAFTKNMKNLGNFATGWVRTPLRHGINAGQNLSQGNVAAGVADLGKGAVSSVIQGMGGGRMLYGGAKSFAFGQGAARGAMQGLRGRFLDSGGKFALGEGPGMLKEIPLLTAGDYGMRKADQGLTGFQNWLKPPATTPQTAFTPASSPFRSTAQNLMYI